jgi:hypothetical protein
MYSIGAPVQYFGAGHRRIVLPIFTVDVVHHEPKENLDPGAQMNLSGSPDRFSNRTSGNNRLSLGVVTVGSNTEVPARGLVANGNPRSQVWQLRRAAEKSVARVSHLQA